MKYFVYETQGNSDGSCATLHAVCPNKRKACQEFHRIMEFASDSDVLYRGAVIVAADHSYFRHELAERE